MRGWLSLIWLSVHVFLIVLHLNMYLIVMSNIYLYFLKSHRILFVTSPPFFFSLFYNLFLLLLKYRTNSSFNGPNGGNDTIFFHMIERLLINCAKKNIIKFYISRR